MGFTSQGELAATTKCSSIGDRLFETMTIISEAHALYTYTVSYDGTLFALVPIPWYAPISITSFRYILTRIYRGLQIDRAFSVSSSAWSRALLSV